MRRVILLLFALMASVGLAMGQVRTVTGVVTDAANGDPLPQAGIQIKGTQNGTVTDNEGRFTLRVPSAEAVLVFTYAGYETQEMPVGAQTTFNVKLSTQNQEIDQVMVVAFGTQKKSSVVGAISSVDEKKLEKLPGADAAKAIEGQIAGVQISNTSGAPGTSSVIRIRGIGSINASSAPLIVVDGAPYNGALNSINPADIASYNVLKDAASAALYGARGANGVILITTKNARKGRTVVNYDGRFGVNMRGIPEYDLVRDPKDHYRLVWNTLRMKFYREGVNGVPVTLAEAGQKASKDLVVGAEGTGGYSIFKDVSPQEYILPDGTINPALNNAEYIFEDKDWNDWEKVLFSPKFRQEHNLSVSKGFDKTKIFFSMSYLDDKGYSMNSYFKRITTRLNVTQEIYKWLDFSNKFQFVRAEDNYNATGGSYINPFFFTRAIPRIHPIYKHDQDGKILLDGDGDKVFEDGSALKDESGKTLVPARKGFANINPACTQRFDRNGGEDYYVNDAASLTFKLPWNISIQTNLSYNGKFLNGIFRQYKFGDAASIGGRLRRNWGDEHSINFNQIIDWNWSFLEHDALNVAVKLGHESYMMKYRGMRGAKTNLLYQEATELDFAAKYEDLSSWQGGYRLEGYFAQASADFLSRYYLSASFRMDGSSVFHPKHRWGAFWSLGASWRISQEEFFAPALDYVNNLKLRLSYGLQGNDNLLLPNGYRNFTAYQDLLSVSNDTKNMTVAIAHKGEETITWEKNYNLSAALEFGLFRGIVNGEFEFFMRDTRDMLFNLPIPAATGYKTKPVNIGDMRNAGVELTLDVNAVNMERVHLDFNFNLTHYKNTILKLPEMYKEKGLDLGTRKLMEGRSIYDWYLQKYQGIDPNSGIPLYRFRQDENSPWVVGTRGQYGDLATTSKDYIGSTRLPDVSGGFGFILDVYGVDLSAQFSYGIGGKVFDDNYATLMGTGSINEIWHKDAQKSWTPENPDTEFPVLQKDNTYGLSSDRFLTTASHLAFKSIVVGYTLPVEWTQKFYVQQFRLYFVCDNVWLWSARKGFDPRMFMFSGGGSYTYSPFRTVSGGIQLRF